MKKLLLPLLLTLIGSVSFAQNDSLKNKTLRPTAIKPSVMRQNTVEAQITKLENALTKMEADLKEINAQLDKLKDSKDSLSELGEEQQLRMQMIMDRMTKADSAASNMLKKFSEIVSQIIGNMK